MLPDRVSNPGPLTYESGALPIALRGPATCSGRPLNPVLLEHSAALYHYDRAACTRRYKHVNMQQVFCDQELQTGTGKDKACSVWKL